MKKNRRQSWQRGMEVESRDKQIHEFCDIISLFYQVCSDETSTFYQVCSDETSTKHSCNVFAQTGKDFRRLGYRLMRMKG